RISSRRLWCSPPSSSFVSSSPFFAPGEARLRGPQWQAAAALPGRGPDRSSGCAGGRPCVRWIASNDRIGLTRDHGASPGWPQTPAFRRLVVSAHTQESTRRAVILTVRGAADKLSLSPSG